MIANHRFFHSVPGVISQLAPLKSVGIGIVCKFEPMASPAFTKMQRIQPTIDELLIGFGIVVGGEFGDLFRSWRQADEIKVKSPNQRAPVHDK